MHKFIGLKLKFQILGNSPRILKSMIHYEKTIKNKILNVKVKNNNANFINLIEKFKNTFDILLKKSKIIKKY